jgi:23S rRNA (uracil1939-C5)-methyltransferase
MVPALVALIAPLRHLLAVVLPDRGRATVTLTLADQGIDVLLAGFEVDGLMAIEALNAFSARYGLARLSVDEGHGASTWWCPVQPTVTFGGVAVVLPDGAFLQATVDGEGALVRAVADIIGDARHVLDLFAGLGTFALALGRPVTAVEGSRDAVLALMAVQRVTAAHRDLFRRPLTAAELGDAEAVILDPPRAGAREQVTELGKSGVARIAYVSCNPSTFARDARVLIDGGYRLEKITPVGQFRWSTHVELAARFSR